MATLTIELGKLNSKGLRPVSFLICQQSKKKRIPTGITLSPSDINKKGKIKNGPKLYAIESKRIALQEKLDNLAINYIGESLSIDTIYSVLTENKVDDDFISFAHKWVGHQNVKGLRSYISAINSLQRFVKKDSLSFKEINTDLLRGYIDSLQGYKRAPSMYLNCIKHIYNEAVKELNTEYSTVITHNPFNYLKIPKQKIRKGIRALTLEELLTVMRYKPETELKHYVKDLFVLSFCLMGINAADLFSCDVYREPYICYRRAKTKDRRSDEAYIEVKVHERVLPLFNRHRGKNKVFDCSDRYTDTNNLNIMLSKQLRRIAKSIGLPNLQFYQARHTFATLSRNLMRFAKSDVDEALNHVGSLGIADVYIKKDFSIINDNNQKLLDYIFDLLDKEVGQKFEL